MGRQRHRRRVRGTVREQLVRGDPGRGVIHQPGRVRQARAAVGKRVQRAHRTNVALAVLPAEVLGKTFEYNSGTAQYEATERAGAPANGVRFILYAINPVTQVPVEPLTEAGYADVLDESTATDQRAAAAARVGRNDLPELRRHRFRHRPPADTSSSMASSPTAPRWSTSTCDNSYSDAANGTIGFDYRLDVPARELNLVYLLDVTQISTPDALADVDVTVSGPHGDVSITGDLTPAGGALTANVNGAPFAIVTLDENTAGHQHHQARRFGAHAAGVRCARRHLGRGAQGNRPVRGPARPDRQPALASPAGTGNARAVARAFSFDDQSTAATPRCSSAIRQPARPPGPRCSGSPPRPRSW